MTQKMKNLLGKALARKLDKTRWCCEMQIIRGIQSRHPHWYQRLLSQEFVTWLRIPKQPWYFNTTTHTVVYKPLSGRF